MLTLGTELPAKKFDVGTPLRAYVQKCASELFSLILQDRAEPLTPDKDAIVDILASTTPFVPREIWIDYVRWTPMAHEIFSIEDRHSRADLMSSVNWMFMETFSNFFPTYEHIFKSGEISCYVDLVCSRMWAMWKDSDERELAD